MKFFKKLLGMDTEKIVEAGADVAKTFSSKEQGTRRHQLDMLSDTPLSKNIRPIIAIWSMLLLTLMLVLKSCEIELDAEVKETVFWVSVIVMGFYFPGRTAEKWMKKKI